MCSRQAALQLPCTGAYIDTAYSPIALYRNGLETRDIGTQEFRGSHICSLGIRQSSVFGLQPLLPRIWFPYINGSTPWPSPPSFAASVFTFVFRPTARPSRTS